MRDTGRNNSKAYFKDFSVVGHGKEGREASRTWPKMAWFKKGVVLIFSTVLLQKRP